MAESLDSFESKPLYQGEIKQKGITVSRSDGVSFTIDSATYQRFEEDGTAVDSSPLTATVDGQDVYGDIDAGLDSGKYYVEFSYTVGPWIGKARLKYAVI